MHDNSVLTCAERVSEALASLQSEIEAGLAALSNGNIHSFEESISRQDHVCQQLRNAANPGSVIPLSNSCPDDLGPAYKKLKQSLLVYAAVVKRITRSFEVLDALHGSAAFGFDAPSPSKVSFEV